MKILMVCDLISLPLGGGMGLRVQETIKSFKKRGHECKILTLDNVPNEKKGNLANWTVLKESFTQIQDVNLDQYDLILFFNYWSPIQALLLNRIIRSKIPFFVCPSGATLVKRKLSLKHIIYKYLFTRRIEKHCHGFISTSSHEYEDFKKYNKNIYSITNIAPEIPFLKNADKYLAKHNLKSKKFLLFLGKDDVNKGSARLVEAFKSSEFYKTGYKLVLGGISSGFNDSQILTPGFIVDEEKWSLLEHCTFLTFPSFSEASGMVSLEAGLMKRPLLTTYGTGLTDLVKEKSGWLSEPDSESLLKSLEKAWADSDSWDEMGRNLERYVRERHSEEVIYKQWSILFEDLAGIKNR